MPGILDRYAFDLGNNAYEHGVTPEHSKGTVLVAAHCSKILLSKVLNGESGDEHKFGFVPPLTPNDDEQQLKDLRGGDYVVWVGMHTTQQPAENMDMKATSVKDRVREAEKAAKKAAGNAQIDKNDLRLTQFIPHDPKAIRVVCKLVGADIVLYGLVAIKGKEGEQRYRGYLLNRASCHFFREFRADEIRCKPQRKERQTALLNMHRSDVRKQLRDRQLIDEASPRQIPGKRRAVFNDEEVDTPRSIGHDALIRFEDMNQQHKIEMKWQKDELQDEKEKEKQTLRQDLEKKHKKQMTVILRQTGEHLKHYAEEVTKAMLVLEDSHRASINTVEYRQCMQDMGQSLDKIVVKPLRELVDLLDLPVDSLAAPAEVIKTLQQSLNAQQHGQQQVQARNTNKRQRTEAGLD